MLVCQCDPKFVVSQSKTVARRRKRKNKGPLSEYNYLLIKRGFHHKINLHEIMKVATISFYLHEKVNFQSAPGRVGYWLATCALKLKVPPIRVRLRAMRRGELSAVIARLMSKCI